MEIFWLLIVLGLLVEAIVETLKPVWDAEKRKVAWPVICSLVVGIAIAMLTQASIFQLLNIKIVASSWLGYIVTGILISRGSSFIHDLWNRINNYATTKIIAPK
ncbi:MAG TPA: hypothetical protein PKB13_11530 [Clostridia bacterium]|nr:hypothetical protein [Clostridia bacterium]